MSTEIKKTYTDIKRLSEETESTFKLGEIVTIEEKVDGANTGLTSTKVAVLALSKEIELSEKETLYGFYNWAHEFSTEAVNDITDNGRYIIYGEWLYNHKVKYPDELMFTFVMFDTYDTETNMWLKRSEWEKIGEKIASYVNDNQKFMLVPLFYTGPFKGWDHVKSFVGQSGINATPHGEGVIVKSQDRLQRLPHIKRMVKVVHDKYSEVKKIRTQQEIEEAKQKKIDTALARDVASEIVTERRVEKALEKLVDKGVLNIDYSKKDIGIIMKNVPKAVYDDCIKEESSFIEKNNDIFDAAGGFGRVCGGLVSNHVTSILSKRQTV